MTTRSITLNALPTVFPVVDDYLSFHLEQTLPYIAPSSNLQNNHPFYNCPFFADDVDYQNGAPVASSTVDCRTLNLQFKNSFNDVISANVGASKTVIVPVNSNKIFSFYVPQPITVNLLTAWSYNNGVISKTIEPVTFELVAACKQRQRATNDWDYIVDTSTAAPVYGATPATTTSGEVAFHNVDALGLINGAGVTQIDLSTFPSNLTFANVQKTYNYYHYVLILQSNKPIYSAPEYAAAASYYWATVLNANPVKNFIELVYSVEL